MQFLKTLLWVTLIVGLTVFAFNNWVPVSVSLWGGLRLDTKLPALVIAASAISFLPLYVLHRAIVWRMKRRILSLEGAQRPTAFPPPPPISPPPAYVPGDAI
jgi:lipopolysaccharide assembly protein A